MTKHDHYDDNPLDPLHQAISERETMEQCIAYVIMLENSDNHSDDVIRGDRIKILKTIYLADMDKMVETKRPINVAETYSALKNGMVPNKVYGIITGKYNTTKQIAPSRFRGDKHKIKLDRTKGYMKTEDDLDMLTEEEKNYIKGAYDEIKNKTYEEIIEMFHDPERFPEWQNPSESIKEADSRTLLQVYAARKKVSEEEVAEIVYAAQS